MLYNYITFTVTDKSSRKITFQHLYFHIFPSIFRTPMDAFQVTPWMALRMVSLLGGTTHIAMIFEGKSMHLQQITTRLKDGKTNIAMPGMTSPWF